MADMTPEELAEQRAAQVGSLLERKREFQRLLEDRAFARVVAGLQAQADSLQQEVVMKPLGSLEEALPQEWKKGRIYGLLAVTAYIEGAVADIEFELRQLQGDSYATDSGRGTTGGFRASP